MPWRIRKPKLVCIELPKPEPEASPNPYNTTETKCDLTWRTMGKGELNNYFNADRPPSNHGTGNTVLGAMFVSMVSSRK